eukprot:g6098.t1
MVFGGLNCTNQECEKKSKLSGLYLTRASTDSDLPTIIMTVVSSNVKNPSYPSSGMREFDMFGGAAVRNSLVSFFGTSSSSNEGSSNGYLELTPNGRVDHSSANIIDGKNDVASPGIFIVRLDDSLRHIEIVADSSTPWISPSNQNDHHMIAFSDPIIGQNGEGENDYEIVFVAQSNQGVYGIFSYLTSTKSLHLVADTNNTEYFEFPFLPSLVSGRLMFQAVTKNQEPALFKAAIDKRDVEQLIVSENQDVSQLWTSLNSALKELDKQAHALDGDMIDVYEVKRRRSSMLETVRKWRASSDMAKQLDREAEIAGVSPAMSRDELAEELSVKSSELNAAMELNRELSERLAAFLVEKTESDLLPSPSIDQSPSSLSPDLLGRLAAKDAAHEAHLRHVSKVHVEQFANLRREMEKDRRILLRKIAKNVRKFKDTHTDIVTKQHTYLANLMDKLNRANEMLKSSGLPVVEDHESTEKTSSSCCGTREDRFDSIRLEHEIDTILDGRYDWKGDAAQKVRLIAKDILLELCRAPECISLVIRHGSIHSTASHLDEDDPHPPGLVVTSKPRHVSDRSSIISKEIEKYPPGIKSLFQSDKSNGE